MIRNFQFVAAAGVPSASTGRAGRIHEYGRPARIFLWVSAFLNQFCVSRAADSCAEVCLVRAFPPVTRRGDSSVAAPF